MANQRIVLEPDGFKKLFSESKELRAFMMNLGEQVAAEAEATASAAEKGPGGRIDGYAAAGFSVKWDEGKRRPRVIIASNADPETALRAYFYTQKVWGVAHIRQALYKFTTKGG